jgi:pimeloyl-ACP methyl ester carboxylesterase/quercetin dioxygenase-like cupin family protein
MALGILLLGGIASTARPVQTNRPIEIRSRFADVNGTRLHYLVAGEGPVVVLLHGYAQTSHMWRPLIPELAGTHTVIAPDLRGAGQSAQPPLGYDKKSLAQDIHALVRSLGRGQVTIVGHDIGLMVAYAYAAQYPDQIDRIVLMDAFLPGVGNWKDVWLLRDLWHFHFYGDTPLKLVAGRERTYFEHFWNDFAADRTHSIPEADRKVYAAAYAQPGGMRAGFEYFKALEQDAADFEKFSSTKLTMPMLVLTGEKASGTFLIDQARLVATDVQGIVVRGSGHWLMEEAPAQVIPALVAFINGSDASGRRLAPAEMDTLAKTGASAGTSGVSGIETSVLKGSPAQAGLYTIVLRVPAHTRIEAHDHPDDRVATVISGTWYFGYGERFIERQLKALPPGSYYTEPPNVAHFARTGDTPVVVQITGFGPTGTRYVKGQGQTP